MDEQIQTDLARYEFWDDQLPLAPFMFIRTNSIQNATESRETCRTERSYKTLITALRAYAKYIVCCIKCTSGTQIFNYTLKTMKNPHSELFGEKTLV